MGHHESVMQEADWLNSNSHPDRTWAASEANALEEFRNSETPAKIIYAEELERLVHQLLPSVMKIRSPARGLRRGPQGSNYYSTQVHSDWPLDFGDYVEKNPYTDYQEHRNQFEKTNASEYMMVNFWRPVLPMSKPLIARPLCVCDPRTVELDDIVVIDLYGNLPGGQRFLGLKFSPRQTWYYYPHMSTCEVLAFKQFHYVKGDKMGQIPVFHTSFDHPSAPWYGIEPRSSFECQVGLLLQ